MHICTNRHDSRNHRSIAFFPEEIPPRFVNEVVGTRYEDLWSDPKLLVQGRSENSHYFGLFNIILSQISPEIISIIRDASQLSKIMTKTSRIRFFFEKWLFFGKVTPNQKKFMLFADLAWSTKMEYFWASLWPSSSYWIIKWHRCILKLTPNFQDCS